MKLELHLIPYGAFYTNMRNQLGHHKWKRISQAVRDANRRTCKFCGWHEQPPIYTECHEVWEFNVEARKQILKGFECLCPTCHAVHHWGHSKALGMNMMRLVEHACNVNKCHIEEFRRHVEASFDEWNVLSAMNFELDQTNFEEMVAIWTKQPVSPDLK
jgi:hypothetical protein